MPVYVQDIFDLLAEIFEERKLKVAVTENLKGGLLTGISAVIGGLLLGPVGLAIGGAVGGGVSAVAAQKKFKSVAIVIKEMNSSQKQKLYEKIKYAFRDFGPQDMATLAVLIVSQASLSELAVKETISFLKNDMMMQVV